MAEEEEEVANNEEAQEDLQDLEEEAEYSRGENARAARKMENEFDREFQALMTESITQRKASEAPKGSINDLEVPAHLRMRRGAPPQRTLFSYKTEDSDDDESDEEAPQMTFQLLSRKGKNVSTSELAVPMDSRFAQRFQAQEEAQQQEIERMRDQVLAIDALEDDDYSRGDPRGGWGSRGGHQQHRSPQHRHGGRYNQRGPQLSTGGGGRGLLEFNVCR